MTPLRLLAVAFCVAASSLLGCASSRPVDLPLVDPMRDSPASAGEVNLEKVPEYRITAGDTLSLLYGIRDQLVPSYALQIRDELDIRFPSLPSFDSTQMVRPDGKITLPYIGDVAAMGKSPSELMAAVKDAYRGTLRDPEVYISVRKFDAGTSELLKTVTSNEAGPLQRVTVRPDGGATFPLVGDVAVAGMTLKELSEALSAQYGRMYDRLSVDVALAQSDSTRVFVLGEVKAPGGYRMDRPRTALEAIALAGGQTPDGLLDEVVAMRVEGKTVICRVIDASSPLSGDKNGEVPVIAPGDVLYVPRSRITSLSYLATRLANIVFFRGASLSFSYNLLEATRNNGTTVIPTPTP